VKNATFAIVASLVFPLRRRRLNAQAHLPLLERSGKAVRWSALLCRSFFNCRLRVPQFDE
jgi:hypothetical protein